LHNLASGYLVAGQFDKALPRYEDALKLRKANLGPDHPDTLVIQGHLDFAHRISAADQRIREVTAERGPDHIDALQARRELAQLYVTMHPPDAAEPILAEILRAIAARPPDDPVVVSTTGMLRRCLDYGQKIRPNLWATFHTQALLGGVLLDRKKYAEAEPLLLKGYAGMTRRAATMPSQSAASIPEALDRLMELYTATHRPDEVKKWRAERAKYPPAPLPTAPPPRGKG
jgi:hypothetical protein